MARRCLAAFAVIAMLPASVLAAELAPYKDRLFAYPRLLAESDGGDYRVFDYREFRDINARDEVPERRVKQAYVSLAVRKAEHDLTAETSAGPVTHVAVGAREGASAIVIYIHGQGGSRRQGVEDFTFGGNFNRLKNLLTANGGLYLSPDFSDFGSKGVAEVSALIAAYARKSPGAPVVVACGSAGGAICWGLAEDAPVAKRLSGLILLGSFWEDRFLASAAFKRRVPVFFAQGSRDRVFPVEKQEAFFRRIRESGGEYPARFVRFESGTHGTPIRMVDWRETLNWLLSR